LKEFEYILGQEDPAADEFVRAAVACFGQKVRAVAPNANARPKNLENLSVELVTWVVT
jgi:hypothetical protein